jgi:hypothetical protein
MRAIQRLELREIRPAPATLRGVLKLGAFAVRSVTSSTSAGATTNLPVRRSSETRRAAERAAAGVILLWPAAGLMVRLIIAIDGNTGVSRFVSPG